MSGQVTPSAALMVRMRPVAHLASRADTGAAGWTCVRRRDAASAARCAARDRLTPAIPDREKPWAHFRGQPNGGRRVAGA
jgi:hypothetical protein